VAEDSVEEQRQTPFPEIADKNALDPPFPGQVTAHTADYIEPVRPAGLPFKIVICAGRRRKVRNARRRRQQLQVLSGRQPPSLSIDGIAPVDMRIPIWNGR
jgi:hypothetical protein